MKELDANQDLLNFLNGDTSGPAVDVGGTAAGSTASAAGGGLLAQSGMPRSVSPASLRWLPLGMEKNRNTLPREASAEAVSRTSSAEQKHDESKREAHDVSRPTSALSSSDHGITSGGSGTSPASLRSGAGTERPPKMAGVVHKLAAQALREYNDHHDAAISSHANSKPDHDGAVSSPANSQHRETPPTHPTPRHPTPSPCHHRHCHHHTCTTHKHTHSLS